MAPIASTTAFVPTRRNHYLESFDRGRRNANHSGNAKKIPKERKQRRDKLARDAKGGEEDDYEQDRLIELLLEKELDEDEDDIDEEDDFIRSSMEDDDEDSGKNVIITDDFEIYSRSRRNSSKQRISTRLHVASSNHLDSSSGHTFSSILLSGNSDTERKSNISTKTMINGLWKMCRPKNFALVFILHVLGVWQISSDLSILTSSSMVACVLALVLSSCSSMIINDIHDAQSGVDSYSLQSFSRSSTTSAIHQKPLISGTVSHHQARVFLNFIYGTLALIVGSFIPGTIAKMLFLTNAIVTEMYTLKFKPITWIKNSVCAMLIAGAPVCSALVYLSSFPAGRSYKDLISTLPLFSALSLQIFAREIVMDLKDYDGDKASHIQTVPVKYGRKYASQVSFICILCMSFISIILNPILRYYESISLDASIIPLLRRTVLAVIGSTSMLRKVSNVKKVEGRDESTNMKFIDDAVGMLCLFASFI